MEDTTKRRIKRIVMMVVLVAAVSYTVFAAIHFSKKANDETCLGVDVEVEDSTDTHFVNRGDIKRLLLDKKLSPVGNEMKQVNTGLIEEAIKEHFSAIKEVECYKTPDATIRIHITQRTPVLRVVTGSSGYYVDIEAKPMPISGLNPVYVPVASGYISPKYACSKLYQFAMFLRSNKFWNSQIEQIYVENNLDVVLIPRVGNQVILMGQIDDFEPKLDKLEMLYDKEFSKCGWNTYKSINLKYDNQVICTRK